MKKKKAWFYDFVIMVLLPKATSAEEEDSRSGISQVCVLGAAWVPEKRRSP
jgi:hypothetical protein